MEISLTFTAPGFNPCTLSGGFVNDNQISGVLNGSGFVNLAVTLNRQ